MACERYREGLADVAAGAPAAAGLVAHIASCDGCRDELATQQRALAVVDAEMARLLSTEPSPELLARVRRAMAETEASPARLQGWMWPAAAVALVVAVALFVGRERSTRPGVAEHRPESPASARASEPSGGRAVPAPPGGTSFDLKPSPSGDSLVRNTSRVGEERVPSGSRLATPRAIPPDILVPPGEAEALLRFAADLQRRTVPPESLLVRDLAAPLAEPKAVEIAPIEIIPLDPAEASGTD